MPKIPLSVGSKLELLIRDRAFVFARFPYTSPYTHTFVRVCIIAEYNEGTKVHNPRRYILLCIVILCGMYIACV